MSFVITKAHRTFLKSKVLGLFKENSLEYLEFHILLVNRKPKTKVITIRAAEYSTEPEATCDKQDLIGELEKLAVPFVKVDDQKLANSRVVVTVSENAVGYRVEECE